MPLAALPQECLDDIFQHSTYHVTQVTDDYQPYPQLYPNACKLSRLSKRFYSTASNALWRYICIEDTEEFTALKLAGLGNALDNRDAAVKGAFPIPKPPAHRVRGIRLYLESVERPFQPQRLPGEKPGLSLIPALCFLGSDSWIARDAFKRTLALILHVCPYLNIVNLAGAWAEETHLSPSLSSAFAARSHIQDLRLHLYHNSMVV